jgi:hypothetical protein
MNEQAKQDNPLLLSDILLREYQELHERVQESTLEKKLNQNAAKPSGNIESEANPAQENRKEKELLDAENERLKIIFEAIHALPEKRSALCLSGGGIRSATFCLGVLQGLARFHLLDRFDYLSTVSGGGYIGGWLTAWIHRLGSKNVFDKLRSEPESKTSPEPKEITHLRSYSNFLSPKVGFLSVDTWTLIAIYLRNLFLNWLMFIPLLLAVLLIPKIYVSIIQGNFGVPLFLYEIFELDTIKQIIDRDVKLLPANYIPLGLSEILIFLGWIGGVIALSYIGSHRPSLRKKHPDKDSSDNLRKFFWCFLIPLILSTISLTIGRAWYILPLTILDIEIKNYWVFLDFVGFVVLLMIFGWFFTFFAVRIFFGSTVFYEFVKDWKTRFCEFIVVSLTGFIGGVFLWLLSLPEKLKNFSPIKEPELYACLDGPQLMLVFLLMGILSIGIGSHYIDNEDREWWARAGAWVLIIIVIWSVVNTLVLYGPQLLSGNFNYLQAFLIPLGSIAGFASILFAISSKTPANDRQAEKAGRLTTVLDLSVKLSAPLFTLFLVIAFSIFTNFLIVLIKYLKDNCSEKSFDKWGYFRVEDHPQILHESSFLFLLCIALVMLVISISMSWCININKFSLHSLYRNRLVRAYLGASNENRKPNPFTGFAHDDNIVMSELWSSYKNKRIRGQRQIRGRIILRSGCKKVGLAKRHKEASKPFHILNMTWNLVNGGKLEWQNRMATTFTVSPLHSGNYLSGYRRSKEYGGENTKSISLGTALTISGAAASPNMGYYSSTFVTFLMTLFNARLGWWLGNPRKNSYKESGPKWALFSMIYEALGQTEENKDYIYLSDGGHFENLGLYEMVLRRCHYIFVVDASRDPDHKFENLGNAIRRIRVDLGVNIEIVDYPRKQDNPSPYCALGNIHYSDIDGKKVEPGILVYIKPNLIGNEPTDVFNYAQENMEFPHESTGDQWFSEQQFESYRELGSYTINQILKEGEAKTKGFTALKSDVNKYIKQTRNTRSFQPSLNFVGCLFKNHSKSTVNVTDNKAK